MLFPLYLIAPKTCQVDAGFDFVGAYGSLHKLEIVSEEITSCSIAGLAMMMRIDSDLWKWFDPALESLMATTEYRRICDDLLDKHGKHRFLQLNLQEIMQHDILI